MHYQQELEDLIDKTSWEIARRIAQRLADPLLAADPKGADYVLDECRTHVVDVLRGFVQNLPDPEGLEST